MKDLDELKDLVKNGLDDINQDFEESRMDYMEDRRKNPANYIGNRGTPESSAWTKMFIPHMLGMVLGFAVARLFHTGFAGYAVFGFIFAFLAGVWKSYEHDRITLKYAIVKNILLMADVLLMILFTWIYYKIND